jgi:hypothetical protein
MPETSAAADGAEATEKAEEAEEAVALGVVFMAWRGG